MVPCEDPLHRLAMSSGDDVPAVAPGSTTYASLSCGHTNAGLRAIGSNGRWGNTALANDAADTRFNQAIKVRMNWHVISSHVGRSNPAPGVGHAEDQPEPRYTLQV